MKLIVSFLVVIVLFAANAKCQTFALDVSNSKQEFTSYSQSYFAAYRPHRYPPGAVTIIGACSIPIGVAVAFYGLLEQFSASESRGTGPLNQSWIDQGTRGEIIGGSIIVVGIGMCIAGGIRDRKVKHPYRWSIIDPQKNEIGFAYNF